jgi:DNA replication factor GINS
MMDLDQLQSVRDRERQTDKLQQLRESFYADAAALIADLREERDRSAAGAEDPFDDPRVSRLTDQISTVEQTVEAIYEKRVGKLVKAASFAAADLPAETEGMTAEEQDLFDALVADIRANRQRVLDVLAGEAPADAAGADDGSPAEAAGGVDAAALVGGDGGEAGGDRSEDGPTVREADRGDVADAGAEPPPPPERPADGPDSGSSGSGESDDPASGASVESAGPPGSAADGEATGDSPDEADPARDTDATAADEDAAPGGVERTTVRITADVGEIFGVDDREYHLEADDVVTLPAANAEPLLDRDAAERVD